MAKKRKNKRGPYKQFCINGHDIAIVGRDKSGSCTKCVANFHASPRWKIYMQNYQKKNAKRLKQKSKKRRLKHKKEISNAKKLAYQKDKQKILNRNKKWRNAHSAELKKYHHRYYNKNKKSITKRNKEYVKTHKAQHNLATLKCTKKRGLRAKIKFGQKGVKAFYSKCPKSKVIDHIIPLQGELVSGLNVIWNLQYLTPKQNAKKYNAANLIKISKWYGKLLKQIGLK